MNAVADHGDVSRPAPRPMVRNVARDAPVALAALAVIILAATTHRFVGWDNLKAILSAASLVGIMAIGLTLVTITGSYVTLAVAPTAVVCAMVFLSTLDAGILVAMALAVGVGVTVSAVQGLVIGALAANPIILTIGAGFLIDGVSQRASGGKIVQGATDGYRHLNATLLGLPISVYVMLALAVVLQLFLRRTATGRQMFFVGESRDAASAAGLPVTRLVTVAFAIAGAVMALGGVFIGAFNQGASQGLEGTLTFDAIAAVLVGGTLISGGRGSALRTLLGALAIAAISNLLLLRGMGNGPQIMIKGLLVVTVVLIAHFRSEHRTA
jgi:ribose/xylose/arabinose/galactoside ABC-type transport system permease subunit